jgi:hypothetical protein
VTDTFSIEKGASCPAAPRSGCSPSTAGKLVLKDFADDTYDKFVWRWKRGTLVAADLGTPDQQTDLAVCAYDQNGNLVGGAVPRGADITGTAAWRVLSNGQRYTDDAAAASGLTKIKAIPGTGTGQILAKGAGATLGMPTLPATLPLTAQLVNLDNNKCWETVFTTVKVNVAGKTVAQQ